MQALLAAGLRGGDGATHSGRPRRRGSSQLLLLVEREEPETSFSFRLFQSFNIGQELKRKTKCGPDRS